MGFHFDNREAAVDHLIANGWHQTNTGRWISRDLSCLAQILLKAGGDVVLVQVWER